jgi:hypothetical protein
MQIELSRSVTSCQPLYGVPPSVPSLLQKAFSGLLP